MNIIITPKIILDKNKKLNFSIEKNWFDYANKLKINLFIITNLNELKKKFKMINPSGLIVTGGGNIYQKEKKFNNLIRDENEKQIISFFKKKNLPILAICRGFQLICFLNNIKLYKIDNHVKKNHNIYNLYNDRIFTFDKINTNSYHNYGVKSLSKNIEKIALHKDRTIEIAKIKNTKIYLFMFHPERDNNDQNKIDHLVKNIFNIK